MISSKILVGEAKFTTFINPEACKEAQKLASVGHEYVDNVRRFISIGNKKLSPKYKDKHKEVNRSDT